MDIRNISEAIRQHRVRITDHADEEAANDALVYDDVCFAVLHG